MRARVRLGCAAAVVVVAATAFSFPASAQYYDGQPNPCTPPAAGLLGAIVDQLTAAQRAQACQRARDAYMREQQEAYAAAQAKAAQAQAEAAQAQAEAAREAAQAEAEQKARARAMAAAETAAETSPDNVCRKPAVAGLLISNYNGLPWPELPGGMERRVVDIKHLVTITNDPSAQILVCHGVWVHTNGMQIEGTMTMKPNVAGDMIVSWKEEAWSPPVTVPVVPSPSVTVSPQTAAPASGAFQQGLADREAWETWFSGTSGDYRTGALYWSAQRSLLHPGSCRALGGDAAVGCVAARMRLTPSDARRKRNPTYRQGWNSYAAQ